MIRKSVVAPNGRYLLQLRARGERDIEPFAGAFLEWAFGWIVHALFYRGQWVVEVTVPRQRPFWRTLSRVATYPVGPVTSRAEAAARLNQLEAELRSGQWTPPRVRED